MTTELRRLRSLAGGGPSAVTGAKAARLAAALQAGLPVLPGWVVPAAEAAPALRAAAAAVRADGRAAGRRAVLSRPLDPVLEAELRVATRALGGRVIVRSSSPLESDPRWSGAFSSVAEVGEDDVAAAVRSCWAAAFAVDPLDRLAACGLTPDDLELGLVIQPELRPDRGGVARISGGRVEVEAVRGHPGPLLSGWVEGARSRLPLTGHPLGGPCPGGPPSPDRDIVAAAVLAGRVWRALGDDVIEWAAESGTVWLLQSLRSIQDASTHDGSTHDGSIQDTTGQATPGPAAPADPADPRLAVAAAAALRAPDAPGSGLASRRWMPLLAAVAQAQGRHVTGRPAAPGTAAGRLVRCRPHERPPGGSADAVLLIDRPLPALAPLLFGARGVIAEAGAAGSHLAEVARSLGVPMVIGCRPETVTGTGGHQWIAAIDGTAGDVALLPG